MKNPSSFEIVFQLIGFHSHILTLWRW